MEDKQKLGDEVFVRVIRGDEKANLKDIKDKLNDITKILEKVKGKS